MFHQQLAYCTTQFVEKDPQTAEPIIRGCSSTGRLLLAPKRYCIVWMPVKRVIRVLSLMRVSVLL